MENHSPHGLLVRYMKDTSFEIPHDVDMPHRDDHYAFIFQQAGDNKLIVDFKAMRVRGTCVFCLLPGQVHQVIDFDKIDAWFVAVAPELVPDHVRNFFDRAIQPLQAARLDKEWKQKLTTSFSLLKQLLDDSRYPEDPFQLIKSATNTVLSMFAAIYQEQEKQTELREGRAAELTRRFKARLQQQYKTVKSPSAYASMLNVSTAYLNEVVKKSTGLPVSRLIQQAIVLEAKRMLYYTDVTVKEIAFELGYEDHAYFTRLFRNMAGISPASFRQRSRSSGNNSILKPSTGV